MPVGDDPDEERVEEVLVVGGDDHSTVLGNVLGARDAQAKPRPQDGARQRPDDRI